MEDSSQRDGATGHDSCPGGYSVADRLVGVAHHLTSSDHRDIADECLQLIDSQAHEEYFTHEQANTLALTAIAHSLQGILKKRLG